MINQLLKLGALLATGRFLRLRIKGLLILLAVWAILWFVHSEFVSYVELSDDRSWVLQASILKLLLYTASVAVYVWLVERPLWPKRVQIPPPASRPADRTAPQSDPAAGHTTVNRAAQDDGFDFLRNKPKLRGSTDKKLNK